VSKAAEDKKNIGKPKPNLNPWPKKPPKEYSDEQ
jgi:hypothetical protein